MSIPLIRYQLDPTGVNPDNAIVDEVHTLTTTPNRLFKPSYGPFFLDSLKVYDDTANQLLVKDVDYKVAALLQEATLKYGKEINELIIIINSAIGNVIRVDYQILGGLYQNDSTSIIDMYNAAMADNRPVDWVSVLNKPLEYPPTLHNHILNDVYGFEYLVVELERIRHAILVSDIPAFEAIIDWVKSLIITMAEVAAGLPVYKLVTFDALLAYIHDTLMPAINTAIATAISQGGGQGGGGGAGLSQTDVENIIKGLYVTAAEVVAMIPVEHIVTFDRLLEFLANNKVTASEVAAGLPVDKLVTFDKMIDYVANAGKGATPAPVAKVSSLSQGGNFGSAVAISKDGTRLAIGAPNAIIYGRRRGVVYVHVWQNGEWVEEARLVASNAFDGDSFGAAVDINADGTRIIVGAPLADYGASWDSGGFYIFRRLTGSVDWEEEVFVTGGSGGPQDSTGSAVAISDDGMVILVGSKDDESNNGTSAGYIFLYYISDSGNAGTWKGLTTGSGGRRTYAADQSQIYFGSCVDMDAAGTRFIAGGWGYEKTGKTYGTGSGLAGIFTASGNSWVRETWLYPNNFNYTKNGEFGWDVAMSDDGSRAVVSSLMGETSGEPYAGAVYVFIRNGTTWTQEAALIPDTVKRYSGYGYSVAINGPGDKILVGAVDGDNSGMNTGLVYVFTRQSGKLIKGIEGWHAVPVHSTGWSVFMRTYAVWYGPNAAGKTFTFTATVNIPATGNYVIDYQADDKGIWSIDGGTKTTVTNYTAATPLTQTLNLTAGNHTLEASIYNGTNTTSADYRSNPGGIAITITDSGGTIIWSTLDDVAQSSPWVQSDKLLPADGLGGDNFGSDVTMSVGGDLVVVGAQYASNSGVSASGKVYTFGTPPTGPALTETIILTGTGRAAGDKLGAAVAMSADGQWMVAGSPYADNPSKTDSGTAYVFKLSPTGWTVYKKLTASNAAASDLFGSSVAISQDGAVVVVGAYGAPTGSPVKGAAYVFELNSALNTYDEKTILTANNSGWLGCSVSINAAGDTIAAGARKTAPSDTGSVFVFNKGANWAAGASAVTVISSTSKTGDNFGTSVSLNAAGDKLAIGAIGADKVGSDSGLVYIFSRSANNWTESFNIKPTDSAAVDWFGYSLAFNAAGDKLIVGSPQSNIAGKSNTGAAYIFSIGATGQQLTKLVPSILDPDCNYGWTVGINAAGDKAMVGAIYSDLAGKFAKGGIAYVHSYDTVKDAWSTSPISASNKAAAMNFGSGISCDSTGNTIAVGAQGAKGTPALTDSGAVYIFS